MKKEKQAIRERRFRLALWTCEEGFEKRGKELCELAEFSVSFALNTIPVAKIVPLLGVWVNTKKEKHGDLETVFKAAKERIPVIVTVQLSHSFSTDKNKPDLDNWDKKYMPKGNPDYYGIYKAEPGEVFKGYLQPPTTEVTAVNAGLTLSIVHWLSDLADVSLYTTRCQLGTPAELAFQAYHLSGEAGKWANVKNIDIKEGIGDVWEFGIKDLFKGILDKSKDDKNNKQNFIAKKRKRIEAALERIVPDKTLKLKLLEGKDKKRLSWGIQKFFSNEEERRLVASTSAWSRLIEVYSPSFLFSVSPAASNAKLIPSPCTVDKKKAKEITSSEIIQVRSSPVPITRISHVICIPPTPTDPTGSVNGDPKYIDVGHYPFSKDSATRVGTIQMIVWPQWLCEAAPLVVSEIPKQLDFMNNPREANDKANRNALEDEGYLGTAYTKYAYLVSAYNTTSAVIITPLRVDIRPGAMIKYHTKTFGDDDVIMYGTVVSVELHLSAGSNPCTTTLVLTNIRDSEIIDDPIENPPEGAGFYQEQFVG